jgi:hypothetical protein
MKSTAYFAKIGLTFISPFISAVFCIRIQDPSAEFAGRFKNRVWPQDDIQERRILYKYSTSY